MKVIILNGSPKSDGNTATALHEAERVLEQQGISGFMWDTVRYMGVQRAY